MLVKLVSDYRAGWDKGRCCKNVAEHGQFALALVPIANRQGRSR
jgi:hypothetical protein